MKLPIDEDFDSEIFGDEYYENQFDEQCPQCGRDYDDIGFDMQYCRACGWDNEKKKWDTPIEPTEQDYMNGDADILTGRWI